jgi:phospholipid/cholesterol/gamma-HCH transport system substrate-binding protein
LRAQLAIQSVVTAALYVRFVMAPDVEPYPAPAEFLGARTLPAIPSDMARFGQLAETIGADLPRTLERIGDVADAVAEMLNEQNRAALSEALAGLAAFASALETAGPDIAAAAADARMAAATLPATAESLESLVASLDGAVADNRDRIAAVTEGLAAAAVAAAGAAEEIEALVRENRGGLRSFTQEGLAEIRALSIQAQAMVRAVERVARRLETEGVGSIIGGEGLPEYTPRSTR